MSTSRRTKRRVHAVLGASALALTMLATTSACGPDNSAGDAADAVGAAAGALPTNLDDLKKWSFEDWEKWAKDYAIPAAAKGYWDLEKLLSAKPVEVAAPPQKPGGGQPPATQAPASQPPATQAPASKPPAGQSSAPVKPSNTQQPASQPPAHQPTQAPASQPPATQAPASQPPATQAPATQAPATQAPATQAPKQPGDNGNDPLPSTINAQAVPHPYTKFAWEGKLFFDDPGTQPGKTGGSRHVCSGTVVSDPAHPGKSNLVWTAGHCVHQGKGGNFYANFEFIPNFNSNGSVSGRKQAEQAQYAPFGQWNGVQAFTSPVWKAEGGETGSPATHYDFALLRVKPETDGGKSLEETVGGSIQPWFNAPREQLSITEYGYPAAPPFDGMELNRCESGKPTRLSFEPTRPSMLAIGCTMTGGSSGGGWLTTKDGKPALVSNVSIGQHDQEPRFQAGPYLDDVAAGMYNFATKKG
ncbi:hypothetical protein ACIGZJ_35310 [Kitasatospora sp. NPDC052868]|uniref:hypothetical protein n=1 Tax=Kitasatospora sp. NPDC052868 TaxID=3364060 RepID=UPI0037C7923D